MNYKHTCDTNVLSIIDNSDFGRLLLFIFYLSNDIPPQPEWVLPVKITCLYIKLCAVVPYYVLSKSSSILRPMKGDMWLRTA